MKRLLLIVLVAFCVRLYRVTNPVADWHAFRQADTASVTREYVKHNYSILEPRYHDLSNIPNYRDNPQGYRMVEFPIMNFLTAMLIRAIPQLDLVVTSRVVSILASLGTLVALFYFVKQLSGEKTAYVSALVFALLPYSIYYSRVILPEPFMLLFSMVSLAAFEAWLRTNRLSWYLTALVALVLALLFKPFVLFLAPIYLVLAWQKWRWKALFQPSLIAFAMLGVAPMLAWREWITQFPEGTPASSWLFNSNGIRLRPAWFRWLFWERLTILFLGYVGALFLPLNLAKIKPDLWIYSVWWMGIIGYFVVIATGNVQHDYYQNLALPIVCISVARGTLVAYEWLRKKCNRSVAVALIATILSLSWGLAWSKVSGYFNVNHWEYVKAGQAADKVLPPDAKVIAPAFGDTQFLFQTNRTGWPIGFEIEDKIAKGATHYVTTSNDDEARRLKAEYRILEENPEYLILDLTQKKL